MSGCSSANSAAADVPQVVALEDAVLVAVAVVAAVIVVVLVGYCVA